MRKMLLALCGAGLVIGQLGAQAQADIYKTPVVCTTESASGEVKL